MSIRAIVEKEYLADPVAYPSHIAERHGLTSKQVSNARASLVKAGKLPPMYGYNGALAQNDPEIKRGYDAIFADYLVLPRPEADRR